MGAAVRQLEVAINWRVTLLGLNLAAWLVAALVVVGLFVHRDTEQNLYPGFGYSIPMFDDFTLFYPVKAESESVVDLHGIGQLRQAPVKGQLNHVGLGQAHGLGQHSIGRPARPDASEDPRPLRESSQSTRR